MLPGTAGTTLEWAARDHPLRGAGERHSPAPPSTLGGGQGAERSRGGVVQVAGDGHVLLTQVGTQLAAGAMGKHTCLGRTSRRANALASPATCASHDS